jgi:hypothetical protein
VGLINEGFSGYQERPRTASATAPSRTAPTEHGQLGTRSTIPVWSRRILTYACTAFERDDGCVILCLSPSHTRATNAGRPICRGPNKNGTTTMFCRVSSECHSANVPRSVMFLLTACLGTGREFHPFNQRIRIPKRCASGRPSDASSEFFDMAHTVYI